MMRGFKFQFNGIGSKIHRAQRDRIQGPQSSTGSDPRSKHHTRTRVGMLEWFSRSCNSLITALYLSAMLSAHLLLMFWQHSNFLSSVLLVKKLFESCVEGNWAVLLVGREHRRKSESSGAIHSSRNIHFSGASSISSLCRTRFHSYSVAGGPICQKKSLYNWRRIRMSFWIWY